MYNTTCPHLFWKIFVNFLTSTLLRTQNTMLLSKVRRRFFQILWPSQKTQTLTPFSCIINTQVPSVPTKQSPGKLHSQFVSSQFSAFSTMPFNLLDGQHSPKSNWHSAMFVSLLQKPFPSNGFVIRSKNYTVWSDNLFWGKLYVSTLMSLLKDLVVLRF